MVYTTEFLKNLELRYKKGYLTYFLLYAAAPVLKKSKPAVLVNIVFKEGWTEDGWKSIQNMFEHNTGLYAKTLSADSSSQRVLIYSRSLLSQTLNNAHIASMLCAFGYSGDIGAYLNKLSLRCKQEKCPHEIGLFLGYPPKDVEGFIRFNGANFLLCGAWKVYSDVSYAKHKWNEWKSAKERMAELLLKGASCQMAVELI